ncbi:hypothetical protein [Streptomyces sp. MJP52]|uniref:hypothetical protein n=1 Tax=Streptomyces sp. MJP52 TaxID=2940555 RepID=UPI002473AEDB|nr:hypothetical protein [Streptomyces sp. MJP52]
MSIRIANAGSNAALHGTGVHTGLKHAQLAELAKEAHPQRRAAGHEEGDPEVAAEELSDASSPWSMATSSKVTVPPADSPVPAPPQAVRTGAPAVQCAGRTSVLFFTAAYRLVP